jgi:hypothetical protein
MIASVLRLTIGMNGDREVQAPRAQMRIVPALSPVLGRQVENLSYFGRQYERLKST